MTEGIFSWIQRRPVEINGVNKVRSFKHVRNIPEKVIGKIVVCAQDAFGDGMTRSEVVDHLDGRAFVTFDDEGEVSGFGVAKRDSPANIFNNDVFTKKRGFYLAGAAVHKQHRGHGLYKFIANERMKLAIGKRAKLIFTRTQNPTVEAGIVSILNKYKEQGRIKSFSIERMEMPSAFKRMLTDEKPEIAENSPYNSLDYSAGDAYVLFFKIKY